MREIEVNLIRGQIVKGLVKPIPVVKIKPGTESVTEFGARVKRVKVNVVVLESPPQPFYEDVVLTPTPAIYADGDAVFSSKPVKASLVN